MNIGNKIKELRKQRGVIEIGEKVGLEEKFSGFFEYRPQTIITQNYELFNSLHRSVTVK